MPHILFVRSAKMAIFLLQRRIPTKSPKKSLQMQSDVVVVTKDHKRWEQRGFKIAAKKQGCGRETVAQEWGGKCSKGSRVT